MKISHTFKIMITLNLLSTYCVLKDHDKLENSERNGNIRPLDLPLEKPMQVRKQQLELDIEQQTGSK